MPSLQPPGQGQGSACSPGRSWCQAEPVGTQGLASLCTVLWGTAEPRGTDCFPELTARGARESSAFWKAFWSSLSVQWQVV